MQPGHGHVGYSLGSLDLSSFGGSSSRYPLMCDLSDITRVAEFVGRATVVRVFHLADDCTLSC